MEVLGYKIVVPQKLMVGKVAVARRSGPGAIEVRR